MLANENALKSIKSHGNELITQNHYASDAIEAKVLYTLVILAALIAFNSLKLSKSNGDCSWRSLPPRLRTLKLQGSFKPFVEKQKMSRHGLRARYCSVCDAMNSDLTLKDAVAKDSDIGRDLEHCEMLIKKFEDFTSDLNASDGRIDTVCESGLELIRNGHPAVEDIEERVKVCVLLRASFIF